jgi:hypothetical protein
MNCLIMELPDLSPSQSELNEQVLQLAKDSQARTQMMEAGIEWHTTHRGNHRTYWQPCFENGLDSLSLSSS